MSLEFLITFFLIKTFTLLSKALGKERPPSHVPQNGAPIETDAHFQSHI
jgi:hypothetical protein